MKKSKTGDKYEEYGSGNESRPRWLIGIDEVGRGPLAGPVTVGAVAVLVEATDVDGACSTYEKLRKNLIEISGKEYPIGIDSKKMKEKDREFWFEVIEKFETNFASAANLANSTNLCVSVEHMSADQIDQKGIAVCIAELVDLNIRKILEKIQTKHSNTRYEDFSILLDGGLKTKIGVGDQKTIIEGDEKELLISLASVYAKVTRDKYMEKLSKNPKYSEYGFELHKGYGTVKHREAIKRRGVSNEHRVSFCKNII